jgi:hypothetical protein
MLELRSSKVNQNRKHTLLLTERKKAVHTLSINQGRVISCAVKGIVPQRFQIIPNGKYSVHTNGIGLGRVTTTSETRLVTSPVVHETQRIVKLQTHRQETSIHC